MNKLIVGNWKMYPTLSDSLVLAASLKSGLEEVGAVEVVLAPPSIWLPSIVEHWRHKLPNVTFGVQNIYPEDQGAYTGEISAYFVKSLAKYAIVGHSERRSHLREDNDLINRKIHSLLRWKMSPILCVGEAKKVLDGNGNIVEPYHWAKLSEQLQEGISGVKKDRLDEVVIAYEPVWAIGSSNPASADYAVQVIGKLRDILAEKYGPAAAAGVRIIYGGSVEPSNALEYLRNEQIGGLLVGGASVKAQSFLTICRHAAAIR
ncbi:MAG: triose-phosphate isomerase [Patescibacteria group bacterium]